MASGLSAADKSEWTSRAYRQAGHTPFNIDDAIQQHDLAPLDVLHATDRPIERVEALRLTDGVALKSFYSKYNNEDSSFDGIRLDDATQGAEDSKKDRLEIIDCTLM